MSATIEEILRLIGEGYTVKISSPNAGVVSVRVNAADGRLVSTGCQRTLDDAMADAYTGTPETEAKAVGAIGSEGL